jgi:hypothetical protein
MSGQVIISLTKTWVENAGAHHASRDFFMHLFISAETREEREREKCYWKCESSERNAPTNDYTQKKNRNGSGGRGSKRRGVGGVLLAGVFTDCPFWADPFSLFIPLLFVAQE